MQSPSLADARRNNAMRTLRPLLPERRVRQRSWCLDEHQRFLHVDSWRDLQDARARARRAWANLVVAKRTAAMTHRRLLLALDLFRIERGSSGRRDRLPEGVPKLIAAFLEDTVVSIPLPQVLSLPFGYPPSVRHWDSIANRLDDEFIDVAKIWMFAQRAQQEQRCLQVRLAERVVIASEALRVPLFLLQAYARPHGLHAQTEWVTLDYTDGVSEPEPDDYYPDCVIPSFSEVWNVWREDGEGSRRAS